MIAAAVVGVASLQSRLVVWTRRARDPLVPPSLLRSPGLAVANVVTFITYAALAAYLLLFPGLPPVPRVLGRRRRALVHASEHRARRARSPCREACRPGRPAAPYLRRMRDDHRLDADAPADRRRGDRVAIWGAGSHRPRDRVGLCGGADHRRRARTGPGGARGRRVGAQPNRGARGRRALGCGRSVRSRATCSSARAEPARARSRRSSSVSSRDGGDRCVPRGGSRDRPDRGVAALASLALTTSRPRAEGASP